MAIDPMDRDPNVTRTETNVYEREGRSSNTLAYLIGGLVVAVGLLAFLFYDGGTRDDVSTTGSTATQTAPAPAAKPMTPPAAAPAAPAAPATPAAPKAPAPQ